MGGRGLLWSLEGSRPACLNPDMPVPVASPVVCVCVCVVSSGAAESFWSIRQGFSLSLAPVPICTLLQAALSTRPCVGKC